MLVPPAAPEYTNAEPWIVTLQPAPVPLLSSADTTIVPVTACAALS
jgi:hypothetical protein